MPCYGQQVRLGSSTARESEGADPVALQEIHAKIMELAFEDCKVYISNVDSQSSAEGGIIVQASLPVPLRRLCAPRHQCILG